MQPQDVMPTVKLVWWQRWLMWNQARRARELWQAWRNNHGQMGMLSKEDDAIMLWAMTKDNDGKHD